MVEERSYGQLREVYVSFVDLTLYFNCPCSYKATWKANVDREGGLADGLGQRALCRRGSMEGDTEGPVCL